MTRTIFRILMLGVTALIIITLAATWYKGYQGSIEFITSIINTRKSSSEISLLIPGQRFRYIQLFLIAVIALMLLISWKFNILYQLLASYISQLFRFLKTLLLTTVHSENKYLMIIPVAGIFYYAIVMPICYDEGLTYIYFTSRSIFSSMSFYPEPNNHILHSLLTNFSILLPFGDTEFRLRLPSLLVSAVTWMLCYRLLLKYYNDRVAMIVTSLASMVFLVFYYSYQSRGYALVNLLFISAFYNTLGIINNRDNVDNWVWFGVSSILGFYTMPSFLYPFLTLNLIILVYNRPNLKKQFITNAIVSIVTVILYLPVIIVNGLAALTSNPWVKPIDRAEVINRLPSFLQQTLNELTQLPWWLILLMLLPSFVYALISRQRFIASLFFIFLIAPPVFLLAQSVIPFPRTFAYYGFILPFLAVAPFATQVKKIPAVSLVIILLICQAGLLFLFNRNIIAYEERDPQLNWSSKKFTDMMVGNKRYFSSGNLLGTTLLYELKTQGYTKAIVDFGTGPVSADTLKNYDYIIIGIDNDQSTTRKPRITTEYYRIY